VKTSSGARKVTRTTSPRPQEEHSARGYNVYERTCANLEQQRIDTAVDDGDVIADDGCLADDDAGGLVWENALANGGGWVNLDGKDLSARIAAVLLPEDVGDAVSLDRKEPTARGGVTGANGYEVGDDGGVAKELTKMS
jgi:hypothetical protein